MRYERNITYIDREANDVALHYGFDESIRYSYQLDKFVYRRSAILNLNDVEIAIEENIERKVYIPSHGEIEKVD